MKVTKELLKNILKQKLAERMDKTFEETSATLMKGEKDDEALNKHSQEFLNLPKGEQDSKPVEKKVPDAMSGSKPKEPDMDCDYDMNESASLKQALGAQIMSLRTLIKAAKDKGDVNAYQTLSLQLDQIRKKRRETKIKESTYSVSNVHTHMSRDSGNQSPHKETFKVTEPASKNVGDVKKELEKEFKQDGEKIKSLSVTKESISPRQAPYILGNKNADMQHPHNVALDHKINDALTKDMEDAKLDSAGKEVEAGGKAFDQKPATGGPDSASKSNIDANLKVQNAAAPPHKMAEAEMMQIHDPNNLMKSNLHGKVGKVKAKGTKIGGNQLYTMDIEGKEHTLNKDWLRPTKDHKEVEIKEDENLKYKNPLPTLQNKYRRGLATMEQIDEALALASAKDVEKHSKWREKNLSEQDKLYESAAKKLGKLFGLAKKHSDVEKDDIDTIDYKHPETGHDIMMHTLSMKDDIGRPHVYRVFHDMQNNIVHHSADGKITGQQEIHKKMLKMTGLEKHIKENLEEHIRKEGDKYVLRSKKSDKHLGTFDSYEAAVKREGQIEYFKHQHEGVEEEELSKMIDEGKLVQQ